MRKNIRKLVFCSLLAISFVLSSRTLPAQTGFVYSIELSGDTINPVTLEYISQAIDKAAADQAECLILKLDTPGGLLTSTRSIVKKILSSEVPVVVYIAPSGARAGSAGVFITYASHVAAMAPSTNIGAAHPVEMGGGSRRDSWAPKLKSPQPAETEKPSEAETVKDEDDPMSHKILNDTVAFVKAIAKERGRNSDWAVKSVTESDSITETEAKEKNVVEFIAHDERELLAQLDGRTITLNQKTVTLKTKDAEIRVIPMSGRQKFFNILADPNIAYILLILGFYGLLYEFSQPGFGIPGIVGGIFIVLAFFAMQTLPTNYAALALIILGLVFFVVEALTPGFGLFAGSGLISMVLGSMLLFDSPVPFMRVSMSVIVAVVAASAGITLFLVGTVLRSQRKKARGGQEGLVGEQGAVKALIRKGEEGKVFVHGELWNATADEDIAIGVKVQVTHVDGMILKVKRS